MFSSSSFFFISAFVLFFRLVFFVLPQMASTTTRKIRAKETRRFTFDRRQRHSFVDFICEFSICARHNKSDEKNTNEMSQYFLVRREQTIETTKEHEIENEENYEPTQILLLFLIVSVRCEIEFEMSSNGPLCQAIVCYLSAK